MEKEFDTTLDSEEFQLVEKFDLPKKELLADPIFEDILHEEEELDFD